MLITSVSNRNKNMFYLPYLFMCIHSSADSLHFIY